MPLARLGCPKRRYAPHRPASKPLGITRSATLIGALAALVFTAAGCEDTALPGAPPRCEPPEELELARGLTRGYRYLAEGKGDEASAAFRSVLELHGEHPQARAGLKQIHRGRRRLGSPETGGPLGRLVIGEREVPMSLNLDISTHRYEEEVARGELARRLELQAAPREWPAGFGDLRAGAPEGIDLVVLHASGDGSAREHLLRTRHGLGSVHFLIDWDGQIYQTLDLARVAHHTGDGALDRRSVAISLINPLQSTLSPLPPEAEGTSHVRSLAPSETLGGEVVRSWGYTQAQSRGLYRLLSTLATVLPDLPRESALGSTPLPPGQPRGVVGASHVIEGDRGPGPGLSWAGVRRALKPR